MTVQNVSKFSLMIKRFSALSGNRRFLLSVRCKTALFLCLKPAGMAFSDWLTDMFTFSASTVWDF